jgi:hypothetical protein
MRHRGFGRCTEALSEGVRIADISALEERRRPRVNAWGTASEDKDAIRAAACCRLSKLFHARGAAYRVRTWCGFYACPGRSSHPNDDYATQYFGMLGVGVFTWTG